MIIYFMSKISLTVHIKLLASIAVILATRRIVFTCQGKETLLESHVQGSDCSLLLPVPLEVLDCSPLSQAVTSCAVAVVVTVYTLQPLHLLRYLYCVLFYEGLNNYQLDSTSAYFFPPLIWF